MSNVFVTLPVPAADGVGAWVDVSGMVPFKTISVDGGPFNGALVIEMSNDGEVSAAPSGAPPFTAPTAVPQDLNVTAQSMRVRRSSGSTFGSPIVTVAAASTIGNQFGALVVPAADGTGTAIDLSSGGDVQTFGVVGPFRGQLRIEISTDGTNFSPALTFDSGSGVAQTFLGTLSAARVRRVFVNGGPTPVVWVGSGTNTGSGGGGTGILFADSIQTVGTTLLSIDSSGFPDGTLCYVGNETFPGQGSIRDYVGLITSADLAEVEGESWPATQSGRWWVRKNIAQQLFLDPTVAGFWAVTGDGSLGTDIIDNDGFSSVSMAAAAAHPISMKELNRRGVGFASRGLRATVQVQQNDPLITLDRDELGACVMTNWYTADGNGYPMWRGLKTPVGDPFTVTAYAVAVPSAGGGGTGFLLSAVGLGSQAITVGFPAYLESIDGNIARTFCVEAPTADQVRTMQPINNDPVAASGGTLAAFTPGQRVQFFTFPGLPLYPWLADQVAFHDADGVAFTRFEVGFSSADLGFSNPQIYNCTINGGLWKGGSLTGVFSNVAYTGLTQIAQCSMDNFGGGCVATDDAGAQIAFIDHSHIIQQGTFDCQASGLLLRNSEILFAPGNSHFSMFNSPGVVSLDQGGSWLSEAGTFIYGNNNTGAALEVAITAGSVVVTAADINFVTTLGGVLQVQDETGGFALYNPSDISIIPLELGFAGIVDVTRPSYAGTLKFSGQIVTSAGGATTTFLGDVGTLLSVANQTTPQRTPTSKRRIKIMRVTKILVTAGSTSPAVVTLMKNNAATAQTLTVPAANPVGTKYVTTIHPIGYDSGDDYDCRVTAVVEAGVPGPMGLSVAFDS